MTVRGDGAVPSLSVSTSTGREQDASVGLRRIVGSLLGVVVLTAACASAGGGGGDAVVGSSSSTTVPAVTVGDSVASSGLAESGVPVSVLLDESNTGLRGAIAAGLWPGNVADPYAGLRRFDSTVVIDDAWLAANNGGSRVVEGIEVVGGSLKIETTGVTVRFCHVVHDSWHPVKNQDGGSGFTMEWCEIDSTRDEGAKAVYGSGFTLRRLDVEGGDDGIYLSRKPGGDVLIDEVYVHHQKKHPGAHADQIQVYNDGDVIIQNSKLIGFYKDSNAPIQTNAPPSTGVRARITVRGNYLFGGVVFINGGGRSGSVYEHNYFAFDSTQSSCFANTGNTTTVGTNYLWGWIDGISHQGDQISPDGNYELVALPPPPPNMPTNGTPITKTECSTQW